MGYPQKTDFPDFRHTFRGGNDTVREKPLLPVGAYSRMINMRNMHPGLKTRPGQSKLHTLADTGNTVMSLFQFSKGKKEEHHLFAQMSDGDILKATNNPPTVTTGAFGSEVFDGNSDAIPASWGNINDMLIFSNGKDQHQIWPGVAAPVTKLIVYRGSGTIPAVPVNGEDYSIEASDDDTNTVVPLDSLSTLTNYDCIFIGCPVMPHTINWNVKAFKENGSAAVVGINYKRASDSTLVSVSGLTDTTSVGGVFLAQAGSTSFTLPTDAIPSYMFGQSLFWIQVFLSSGSLDSEVELESVTYDTDWQDIVNMWDGVPIDIIEAQLYKAASGTYSIFSAASVDLSLMSTSDKLCFSSMDLIEGIYIDPGETPNTTAGITLTLKYWDGTQFTTVGTVTDGGTGFTKAGWVTFPRKAAQPTQFNNCQYYAYWYELTITGGTLSDDISFAIKTMPYFDISELGKGICNLVWKGRAVWAFDKVPNYLLISGKGNPQQLNGDDYAILEAGDGRLNPIRCMRKFHNEYMVWQEERGVEGGCLTLFEGYSPATYGKLVLSSRVGSLNAHSAVVVDGVMTSTRTDEEIKTISFFISHAGVCMSDGKTARVVSDAIQNYFDPTKDECIRRGYESKMWLKYDAAFNVIRVGLVSGVLATECNVFPVYDIQDGTWSFDELGQSLATMEEIEADAGSKARLQIGGGVGDGTIYLLNSGNNDVSEAIDSYVDMEIDGGGAMLDMTDMILRLAAGSGPCTVTIEEDGVEKSYSKTITKTAVAGGETYMIKAMVDGDPILFVYNGYTLIVNSASPVTLYLPAASAAHTGFKCEILKLGAGSLTLVSAGAKIDDGTVGGTIACTDAGLAKLEIELGSGTQWMTNGTNTWTTT